ncbi:MAG: TrkH family potassium uptake protein [Gammaproteobacteria bacterium]|nr:TrkH family potassium uptake protein [Gammaproteobacteria bacterium]
MTSSRSQPFFLGPLVVLGHVLSALSLICVPPLLISLFEDSVQWKGFLYTAVAAFVAGRICVNVRRGADFTLSLRQMFIATTLSWAGVGLFAALPFAWSPMHIDFTDAVFESVSGLTTTGSTVLAGLDAFPRSLLLWRGMLQWLGGIGIVVLAISVLPFLSVGGMRLFRTESSDWSGKSLPRLADMIKLIQFVYVMLSLVFAVSYWLAGMNWFDAAVHAMTTVATGGFANYDASFSHWESRPIILWLSALFMLLSALPFMLYIRMLRGDSLALYRDQQVRGFVQFVAIIVVMLIFYQHLVDHRVWSASITHSVFNAVSIVTTTGYASEDYTQWGPFAFIAFFYLTFVGGCSGSTTGAIKVFRFQIAIATLSNQMRAMMHPHGLFPTTFNGEVVREEIVRSLIGFSFFYGLTVAVIAFILSWLGLDFITALSSAATAVGNVGPGLGGVVGPAGNFASLPDAAKWVLTLGMLLGRLEIMTVLIMFTPGFWR